MPRSRRPALHFATQQDADSYVVSTRIATIQAARTTRTTAARLTSLQERVAALKAPIYKLSDDLLSLVFLAAYVNSEQSAITVSHVTSRFRRIALSTSRLWTSITLRLPCSPPLQVTMLNLMSRRSGTLPLRMRMRFEPLMDRNGLTPAVIAVLYGLRSRCQQLCLKIERWDSMSQANRSVIAELARCPLMESLDLDVMIRLDWPLALWTVVTQCSRLRHLTFEGPTFSYFSGQPQVCFQTLKTACLPATCFSNYPFRLPNCNALTVSGGLWYYLDGDHSSIRWKFPALRRLVLAGCSQLRTWTILSLLLGFPTIQDLVICDPALLIHDQAYEQYNTVVPPYPAHFCLQTLAVDRVQRRGILIAPFLKRLLDPSDATEPRVNVETLRVRECDHMDEDTKAWLEKKVNVLEWVPGALRKSGEIVQGGCILC